MRLKVKACAGVPTLLGGAGKGSTVPVDESVRRCRRGLSAGATTLGRVSGVTALGSWPGTDIRACIGLVREVFAGDPGDGAWSLPYLPELPDRGPGAELIGRSAAFLEGLAVDLQPSGWRIVDRPGRDARRTAALLRQDLDELAEAYDGYVGPLKLQVAGPWTLAANLRVTRGERAIADPGAACDIAQSLAQGIVEHLGVVSRLVPGARLVLQLDEPSLPAVLAGRLTTSSGFGRHRAVDPDVVERGLRTVIDAARSVPTGAPELDAPPEPDAAPDATPDLTGEPGSRAGVGVAVHCCAPDVPLALLRSAGAAAISLDTALLTPAAWESVAVTVEAGVALWAGIDLQTHSASGARGAAEAAIEPLRRHWRELGLPAETLDGVVVTPPCGLAGLSPAAARAVHRLGIDAARALTEGARA